MLFLLGMVDHYTPGMVCYGFLHTNLVQLAGVGKSWGICLRLYRQQCYCLSSIENFRYKVSDVLVSKGDTQVGQQTTNSFTKSAAVSSALTLYSVFVHLSRHKELSGSPHEQPRLPGCTLVELRLFILSLLLPVKVPVEGWRSQSGMGDAPLETFYFVLGPGNRRRQEWKPYVCLLS